MRFRHLRQGLRTFGSREAAAAYGRGKVTARFCSSSRSWIIAWWWLWLLRWPQCLVEILVVELGCEKTVLLGQCFVKGPRWSAVPREGAPLGSVSYESIRDWVIILLAFSVFLLGFRFCSFPFCFSNFRARKCWAGISSCETEGNWYRRGGHGKRFREDGESDIDADVERCGM